MFVDISFYASGINPCFLSLRSALAQICCSIIFSPWPEARHTTVSVSEVEFKSKPAPLIELDPMRPGSFNHGPPELLQAKASPDFVTMKPPIVSPASIIRFCFYFFLAQRASFFSLAKPSSIEVGYYNEAKSKAFAPLSIKGGLVACFC